MVIVCRRIAHPLTGRRHIRTSHMHLFTDTHLSADYYCYHCILRGARRYVAKVFSAA